MSDHLIGVLNLLLTFVLALGAIFVTFVLNRKANNLQVAVSKKSDNLLTEIGDYLISEITTKITGAKFNDFSTYIDEYGKPHKAVIFAPVVISGKADITAGPFIKGAVFTPVIISGKADIKAEIKKGE
jgi:hypothetical protein